MANEQSRTFWTEEAKKRALATDQKLTDSVPDATVIGLALLEQAKLQTQAMESTVCLLGEIVNAIYCPNKTGRG